MEDKQTQFEEAAGTKQGTLNNEVVRCTHLKAEGKGKMEQAGMKERRCASGPGRETARVRGNSYCTETCEGECEQKHKGTAVKMNQLELLTPCWNFATVPNYKVLRDTCYVELYSFPISTCKEATIFIKHQTFRFRHIDK